MTAAGQSVPENFGRKERSLDVLLVFLVFALCAVGLLVVYSASAMIMTARAGVSDTHYVVSQAQGLGLGLVVMIVASQVDYRLYGRFAKWILAAGIVVLSLTLVPALAIEHLGATRWVRVPGIGSAQPVEVFKVSFSIFLAYSLDKKFSRTQARTGRREETLSFREGYGFHLLLFVFCAAILLTQPDYGSILILASLVIMLLTLAGSSLKTLALVSVVGGAALAALVPMAAYRAARLRTWLDPYADASGAGYQVVNSITAFARGGVSGVGFGEGQARMGFVPELMNDFAVTVIAEDFGFVGMLVLLGLYAGVIWRGVRIAVGAADRFGRLLAMALVYLLFVQVFVNLGVASGLLPTTGLTLPFISQGSTSLVVLMGVIGILLNIGYRRPDPYVLRELERRQRVEVAGLESARNILDSGRIRALRGGRT